MQIYPCLNPPVGCHRVARAVYPRVDVDVGTKHASSMTLDTAVYSHAVTHDVHNILQDVLIYKVSFLSLVLGSHNNKTVVCHLVVYLPHDPHFIRITLSPVVLVAVVPRGAESSIAFFSQHLRIRRQNTLP